MFDPFADFGGLGGSGYGRGFGGGGGAQQSGFLKLDLYETQVRPSRGASSPAERPRAASRGVARRQRLRPARKAAASWHAD